MSFNEWLDTLIAEKEIDREEQFQIVKDGSLHFFEYGYVIDCIKRTSKEEKSGIKTMLVKIDFVNGDICHYLRHLAQALC